MKGGSSTRHIFIPTITEGGEPEMIDTELGGAREIRDLNKLLLELKRSSKRRDISEDDVDIYNELLQLHRSGEIPKDPRVATKIISKNIPQYSGLVSDLRRLYHEATSALQVKATAGQFRSGGATGMEVESPTIATTDKTEVDRHMLIYHLAENKHFQLIKTQFGLTDDNAVANAIEEMGYKLTSESIKELAGNLRRPSRAQRRFTGRWDIPDGQQTGSDVEKIGDTGTGSTQMEEDDHDDPDFNPLDRDHDY